MFIDLTRHGGGRVLRVAIAAIAYLDACEDGTAVHLVGGQTLRVVEDPASIEALATPTMVACEVLSTPVLTAGEIVDAIVNAWARISDPARQAASEAPGSGAPGAIDDDRELESLRLAEGAGFISPSQAHDQRVDIVKRRRGRR